MNFNLQRQLRLAGFVTQLTGFFLHNTTVLILGISVFAFSYQMSIHKMEKFLEEKEELKEGD